MKFETLEELEQFVETTRIKYESKYNEAFDLTNPKVAAIINQLIDIRMDIVMNTFEYGEDPTNIERFNHA
jgi:hypothetical protein